MSSQVYLIITLCIVGVISGASSVIAFKNITSANPYMKSSWRLQITSACYGLLTALTWKSNKSEYKKTVKAHWKEGIVSGISLGSYFCLWNISLDLTSVAHSLIFLYSCPILLVIYYLLVCKKLRVLEIIGVVFAALGMFVMCYFVENNEGTTWYGDLVALGGALVLGVNLVVSESLMTQKPLMYLFCIHLVAAVFCALLGVAVAPGSFKELFGYFYTLDGVYAAYLGIVCGFIGNGAIYYLLQHIDPLIVSVILNFEPFTGSLFAWCFSLQGNPSTSTWIGGSIVIIGNFLATISSKIKTSPTKIENLDI